MTGITGASAAAGGDSHSLVLKSDGTLRSAGLNTSGQLGDGTGTQRTTAVTVTGVNGITRIDAGVNHSVAVKSDGTLLGWGRNSSGQLGDGTNTLRTTAVQASGLSDVDLIGAGDDHTVAVTTTGVVSSTGWNDYGRLGDGSTVKRNLHNAISDEDYEWKVGVPVFSVDAGTYSTEKTVVISVVTPDAEIHYTLNGVDPTESDQAIASGNSIVIDETTTLKARAWRVDMPPSSVTTAVYTLVVTMPAVTPATGTFTEPQTVSMTVSTPEASIRYTTDGSTPTESSLLYAQPFSIDTSTTVKATGFRSGWSPSTVKSVTLTLNYGTLLPPEFSPAGAAFTNSGEVFLSNEEPTATIRYTLDGSTPNTSSTVYTPPLVLTAGATVKAKAYHPDYTASAVSSATYTFALSAPSIAPASGTYDAGQLITITPPISGVTLRYTLNGAEPTSTDSPVPPSGTLFVGDFVLKVKGFKTGATDSPTVTGDYRVNGSLTPGLLAGGDVHSVAISPDGAGWAFGDNGFGQLGNGSTNDSLTATAISGLTGVVALTAGDRHSLAIVSGGELYAWGHNQHGKLGDGTQTQRKIPTLIPDFTAAGVDAGTDHTLAVKADGTAWAWGLGQYGRLGDGTTDSHSSPVQVAGLSNVSKVAAGSNFSSALKSDGTAWTWGRNAYGQLGSGNTTDRSTAGQVSGITTAVAIAAGYYHVLALLSDGTVRAWGYNANGRLGDGTTTQRTSPVTVSTISSITAIASGESHSLALKGDGTVWVWGYNGYGQLGDGTTTQRLTPIQVPGLPQIQAIAAGTNHSLALGTDGSVWVWGSNSLGQVGDGTTTTRKSPVQIANAGMFWKLPNVKFSLPSGRYFSSLAVTVMSGDDAAVIHYTTNGVDPTESDPTITSGSAVTVDQSLTLKAKTWKAGAPASNVVGATYELKAVLPTLTPASGRYAGEQTVSISTSTPSATLRYTLDGSEPAVTSTAYGAPFQLEATRTVKARAYRNGWTASDTAVSSFWILEGPLDTPDISQASGAYSQPTLVILTSSDTGVVIRYRLDGEDPDESSPIYRFPLLVTRTTTLSARAFRTGASPSEVATATLTFDATGVSTPPTILSPGGQFATRQAVQITGATGATMRYTTTGEDPTATDAVVPENGLVTVDSAVVLKARAWEAGLAPSSVSRVDLQITGAVVSGGDVMFALAAGGTLWGWGANGYGAVGDGTTINRTTPVMVLEDVVSASTLGFHSLAAREDGSVWAWGEDIATPTQVTGLEDIVEVAAGMNHSLARGRDGRVWAWGNNQLGQLGDGTTTNRQTPVLVLGLGGITRIAAGYTFSLAVEADGGNGGVVWAWGTNNYGQLGEGSTVGRLIPVQVVGIQSAVQVAVSRDTSFARLADGSLRTWGRNFLGQLGDTTTINSNVPITPVGFAPSHAVGAGTFTGIVVDRLGLAWGLGKTTDCMFGAPSPYSAHILGVPYRIPGFTEGAGADSGDDVSMLLRWDGTVWTTGKGYLGFGTLEEHCAVRALPDFSLASNGWLVTDGDGDGLPAWKEYALGMDPLDFDTNDNGVSDGIEAAMPDAGSTPDNDGDGVPNVLEVEAGTDPLTADTDGDGYDDRVDAFPLDPARHEAPQETPNDTTPPTITLTEPTTAVPRP